MTCLSATGKGLWAYRKTLIIFLVPAIASPLLMYEGPGQGGWVTIVMASYWITEALPLAVTSLLPIILFPLLGILDTDDVCRIYLKDTTMLFVGSMMMAVAIEYRNLHRRIALGILMLMGSKPRWLMLGFMLTTAFLSMWISNTATTAMMVPIVNSVVLQILRENKKQRTRCENTAMKLKVMKDKENGAMGNDTNQDYDGVASEESELHQNKGYISSKDEDKITSFEGFEEAEKEIDFSGQEQPINYEELPPNEKAMCKGLFLCVAYAATIGGTTTLTGTGTTVAMSGIISQIYPDGPNITFANWIYFMLPATIISLFICWMWLQFFFLDRNLTGWCKDCACCSDSKEEEGGLGHQVIKKGYQALGPISFAEVGVLIHFVILIMLWLFRESSFIPNFGGWASIFPVSDYIGDATVAIIVAMSLFIYPSEMPWYVLKMFGKANHEMKPGPVPALIDWKIMQRMMPWNIVFLLGGGFALASGCQASGLSEWLAEQFSALSAIPAWSLVVILTIVLCLFTEVTSNVATTTIFLPICASLAESICINPLYLIIPSTLACTYAYMLPVATPPNAVVFSYGTISILDMVSAGIFMNFVGIIIDNILINTMGLVVYDVYTYPSWADDSACVVPTVI